MPRPAQKRRFVPAVEALWRGLTTDEIAVLQEALNYFDDSYDELMAMLQQLGATKPIYEAVNGVAVTVMGKHRYEVDKWSRAEMEDWGDGYQGTMDELEKLEFRSAITEIVARTAAERGFANRSQESGW